MECNVKSGFDGGFIGDTGFNNSSSGGFNSHSWMNCLSTSAQGDNLRQTFNDLISILLIEPDVDPKDIEAIYKDSEYLSFREQCGQYPMNIEPSKNNQVLLNSVPGSGFEVPEDQRHYEMANRVRLRKNYLAKKSRYARRQLSIENQIKTIYLSKKVQEMQELKRQMILKIQGQQL